MKAAYAGGVNLFDNAEAYASGGAETLMGEAIARGEAEGVWRRSDLVVTTKLFFGTALGANSRGLSRKHIVEGLAASLARLRLPYVDIVYAHRPDPVVPIEETVRAFNHVLDRGQAFYWGTSEWSCAQIAEACAVAGRLGLVPPQVEQPEYSLFARQRVELEYAPLYDSPAGLGLTTWSPLASGVLTGKYSGLARGAAAPAGSRLTVASYKFLLDAKLGGEAWQIEAADELAPLAAQLGCSRAQLAIAWVLRNERVSTCILGATTLAQLEENLAALDVLPRLTAELAARAEAVGGGRAVPARGKVDVQVRGIRDTSNVLGVE